MGWSDPTRLLLVSSSCFLRRVEPNASTPRLTLPTRPAPGYGDPKPARDRYWLHLLLFFATLVSTVYASAFWLDSADLLGEDWGDWAAILNGLRFAGSLLLFLTIHEFGHYFAARYHGVRVSLPYYIPFPLIGSIGTFGAVIRIREPLPSTTKLFDIGAAGPLAGFVPALGILLYALATLPTPDYLLSQPGHELLKAYILEYGRFPNAPAAVR